MTTEPAAPVQDPPPAQPPAAPPAQPPAERPPQDLRDKMAQHFSQEEQDLLFGQTRQTARSGAAKALAEELGMSVEDAKATLKKAEEERLAALSESDRRVAEAEAKAIAAEQAAAAATASARQITLERELETAGMDSAVAARMAITIQGATPEEIKAEIEAMKTETPALFTAQGTTQQAAPPSSRPAGQQGPSGPASGVVSDQESGRDLFRNRNKKSRKSGSDT